MLHIHTHISISLVIKERKKIKTSRRYHFFMVCCSVARSCPTLFDPTGCSMPGFPVLYYLLEFAQTHTMTPSNHLMLCAPQASPLKHLHLMDSGRGSWSPACSGGGFWEALASWHILAAGSGLAETLVVPWHLFSFSGSLWHSSRGCTPTNPGSALNRTHSHRVASLPRGIPATSPFRALPPDHGVGGGACVLNPWLSAAIVTYLDQRNVTQVISDYPRPNL